MANVEVQGPQGLPVPVRWSRFGLEAFDRYSDRIPVRFLFNNNKCCNKPRQLYHKNIWTFLEGKIKKKKKCIA